MATLTDLSLLPPPDIIESLDFEKIFQQRKDKFIALYSDEQQQEVAKTLQFESEPIVKLLQESAYYELILRQRINEASQALMIAHAKGRDLDNLGANFNVQRLVIQPEDNTVVPVIKQIKESDSDFRLRIQSAFEGLSVAGPRAAYEFFARSADGRVLDAAAESPSPACVTLAILSRENNGKASDELIAIVKQAVNEENRRPIADRVTVKSVDLIHYNIKASLYLYPGPESEPIKKTAINNLQNYITEKHRIGRRISRSAIISALHVVGVERVELHEPVQDILVNREQASFCSDYQIGVVSYGE
ncbi:MULTISPECIES: baseplate J/gp47 family protein [unclassified Gilliamella]|uniref:baseplate J/gp47 family protein n=1 Tax=unclassified Gilliamella TaxID=2685620 RepID=UPI00226A2198|nr:MULTISPECIES: baseplate J/gp47 family protein [unclassified Gilliamella]MCX8727203.1 baseplate J/gp47 family protein [Gilliamella sp. B2838]MCX8738814.1 baseplate J/gp47 family protein [Gilliamella sp. B2824]